MGKVSMIEVDRLEREYEQRFQKQGGLVCVDRHDFIFKMLVIIAQILLSKK